MNKLAIALSAAVAVGASFSASAQSGTITIDGEVIATTCTITWPGAGGLTENPTVVLPKVPVSSLAVSGATAGKWPILLQIGGTGGECTSGKAALELNPTRNARVTDGRLDNLDTTGATNVQIALRDAKDDRIDITTPWRSEEIDLTASTKQIEFAAEYYAAGVATAGKVNATVDYTIDYN
ncbi:fimbrial protein [Stenotrophomonas tumulicola]|uniref:Type 1 fimbrial protein n=1 Tax=Stenotrophomonas tumulicola TaxID=1685415 RepID=A0A7W3FL67_9GAMM|nr:fimbrial protein [Stenotrophomonas tumulicola]MBA8681554.1 type 1 fimbrial protein [Stenotrophomonas tumulicola]